MGINDLKDRPGKKICVRDQFNKWSKKIEDIRSLCPYSKLILSPILPTKLPRLNERALEFNRYLFQSHLNVQLHVLDFDSFANESASLCEKYGSYNKKDRIHLGRNGIRHLAVKMRNAVFYAFRDGRSYAIVNSSRGVLDSTTKPP